MDAIPTGDLAKDVQNLDLSKDELPLQRSLGVCWNIITDMFTFRVQVDDKAFTCRGVLSVLNGIFDPLGFVAPVTVQGRFLLRQLSTQIGEWDSPLPDDKRAEREKWEASLQYLQELQIPQCYFPFSYTNAKSSELSSHVCRCFCQGNFCCCLLEDDQPR